MTTPAEKDAMALAVLDNAALSLPTREERADMREANAHLAARLAELEAENEMLRQAHHRCVMAGGDNLARATRAEAELAAVRAACKRTVDAFDAIPQDNCARMIPLYINGLRDAAIDAARGEGG